MVLSRTSMDSQMACSKLTFLPLNTIRIKVTDRCTWNCYWCHNEGTGERNTNLTGDIEWNDELENILWKFQSAGFNELHLTGGEPTGHPNIGMLIRRMKQTGFHVKMTSIGCSLDKMTEVLESGLDGINFSLHSLNPVTLNATQVNRNIEWTTKQLEQELVSITRAKQAGIPVKVNSVISTQHDYPRAISVIEWARANDIPVRFMNELNGDQRSAKAVLDFCSTLGATEFDRRFTLGGSSYTIYYRLSDGYEFGAKLIRNVFLDRTMCSSCMLRIFGACSERFYGIRLEKRLSQNSWNLHMRLCLHRTESETLLLAKDFFASEQWKEIQDLRHQEWLDMSSLTK